MILKYLIPLTALTILCGCQTTTITNSTTVNTAATTSALEEVPADVNTNDVEVPALEPIATSSEQLIGSWQSPCLIPDENSDYAEQHYFVFYANRTATHTRETFYKKACVGSDMTLVNNYTYTIPTSGQINFTDSATGETFYDIYMMDVANLTFGHGFRNHLTYPTTDGGSEAARISTLNQYIIYSKTE